MSQLQEILNLAEQHNGLITSAMVNEAGFSRGSLKYLVDTQKLIRSARGVYTLPDAWDDEFINLQARYKRGIFSLDTALYLSDLTDQTPNQFHMTFPSTYNVSNPKKDGILCNSASEVFYSIGIEQKYTPMGNSVLSYSAERTLCDILRPRNNTDIQIIVEAFKRYTARLDKNIPLLSEYSRLFKVESRVRSYLEVLL